MHENFKRWWENKKRERKISKYDGKILKRAENFKKRWENEKRERKISKDDGKNLKENGKI